MKNKLIIGLVSALCIVGFLFFTNVYYNNQEISVRNTIKVKLEDNKNQFDSMWKQISQLAQVTKEERSSLTRLITDNAQQRNMNDKVIMAWVQEAIPNVSNATYLNLQNTISNTRAAFATRQTELLDLQRQHQDLILKFPSSMFIKNKQPVDVVIVTSEKTQNTFSTKQENDVDLFSK